MEKPTPTKKQQLKELNSRIDTLRVELLRQNKAAGIDEYIDVKRAMNQSRFERVRIKGESDRAIGHYFIQIEITAKKANVFIPLSIASGKKPTGFIYQIEGTAEGVIKTAKVTVRGEGVTQITLGTIIFAKIPAGHVATFTVRSEIRGKTGKVYKLLIHQINYKLNATDARYRGYTKEIQSEALKFS